MLFSQRQKVVLTLAIRGPCRGFFVQLRIAKVKTTFCLCENSTLNYEAKDILNRGRREGEEYTKIQIATKLLSMGNDIKSVAELAELPQETVEKLAQSISKEEK